MFPIWECDADWMNERRKAWCKSEVECSFYGVLCRRQKFRQVAWQQRVPVLVQHHNSQVVYTCNRTVRMVLASRDLTFSNIRNSETPRLRIYVRRPKNVRKMRLNYNKFPPNVSIVNVSWQCVKN